MQYIYIFKNRRTDKGEDYLEIVVRQRLDEQQLVSL